MDAAFRSVVIRFVSILRFVFGGLGIGVLTFNLSQGWRSRRRATQRLQRRDTFLDLAAASGAVRRGRRIEQRGADNRPARDENGRGPQPGAKGQAKGDGEGQEQHEEGHTYPKENEEEGYANDEEEGGDGEEQEEEDGDDGEDCLEGDEALGGLLVGRVLRRGAWLERTASSGREAARSCACEYAILRLSGDTTRSSWDST